MVFTKKKLKTRTLGEALHDARANLGLSLEEAGRYARVQPKFLRALENGAVSDLPASVYVKGFLRNLAKLYQLDGARLIEMYEQENVLAENVNLISRKPKGLPKLPSFVLTPKSVTISAIVLIGAASLVYLYFQVNSLVRPPRLLVESPAEDGTTNISLQVLEGTTEPGSDVYLNGQEIMVDAEGSFRENLSLGIGPNQLLVRAINKFGKETIITRNLIFVEKDIAGTYISFPEAEEETAGEKLVVEISAENEAAWVSITADSREIFSGTMLAGSNRKIEAIEEVKITSGNGGATRVIVNGEDQGLLGAEGEVVRDFVITKSNR